MSSPATPSGGPQLTQVYVPPPVRLIALEEHFLYDGLLATYDETDWPDPIGWSGFNLSS